MSLFCNSNYINKISFLYQSEIIYPMNQCPNYFFCKTDILKRLYKFNRSFKLSIRYSFKIVAFKNRRFDNNCPGK